jgi:DNA-binding response OmpR family regulator
METDRILVFGDGSHLFRTISCVLEYQGYDVSQTPRPEIALALLIEQNYDLIIARLRMEDLQSLDVLKRAKKLNPEVSIPVVSDDSNVAFPLEAYQIEVNDYLLLPISPSELMRRMNLCLKKVAEVKRAKANEQLSSRIMLMFHDIRGSLVSTAASLKLLRRGKYGSISSQAADQLQELSDKINHSTNLIDEFAQEMLPGLDQVAPSKRSKAKPFNQLKSVPRNPVHRLRPPAETIGELTR